MPDLRETIAAHPFTKGLDPSLLPLLVEGAQFVRLPTGTLIGREGELATRFYLLRQGQVAIEAAVADEGAVKFQTIGGGDALGWSWLFPPYRWHFTSRALTDVEAVMWDTAELRHKAQANPLFGYEMAARMTRVLLQRLQATRRQLDASEG